MYIVHDLNTWSRNPSNNFKFQNCLFGATNTVENNDQEKYVCSGYIITFDSAGSWSFDNGIAKTVIIFCVENSSSSHANNRENNFLILGEGPTFGINGTCGLPEKKATLILLKQIQRFA